MVLIPLAIGLTSLLSASAFANSSNGASGPVCWNNPNTGLKEIPGAATGMFVRQETKSGMVAGEMCITVPALSDFFRLQCQRGTTSPYFYFNIDIPGVGKAEAGLGLNTYFENRQQVNFHTNNPDLIERDGKKCVELKGPLQMVPYMRVYDPQSPWPSMSDRWRYTHLPENLYSPGDRVCMRMTATRAGELQMHVARWPQGQPQPKFDGTAPALQDPTPADLRDAPEVFKRHTALVKKHLSKAILRRTIGLAHSKAQFWTEGPFPEGLEVKVSQSRVSRGDGKWVPFEATIVHQRPQVAPAKANCWTTRWPMRHVSYQSAVQRESATSSAVVHFQQP